MSEKTITLADGRTITMRAPTEAEMLAYLDRRADIDAGLRPSLDANDDGDRQLEVCVTAPDAKTLAELLEDFPLLNQHLKDVFKELAGSKRSFIRADELIMPEYRRSGARLVAFLYDGPVPPVRAEDDTDEAFAAREAAWQQARREQAIVLSKLTRFEVKALEHETREGGRKSPLPSALAKLAKQHVTTLRDRPGHKEELRDRIAATPLLAANLGYHLFDAATAKLAEEQGKS